MLVLTCTVFFVCLDLCHWGNIVELELAANHLSSLPNEIEALKSVEVLRASSNKLRVSGRDVQLHAMLTERKMP